LIFTLFVFLFDLIFSITTIIVVIIHQRFLLILCILITTVVLIVFSFLLCPFFVVFIIVVIVVTVFVGEGGRGGDRGRVRVVDIKGRTGAAENIPHKDAIETSRSEHKGGGNENEIFDGRTLIKGELMGRRSKVPETNGVIKGRAAPKIAV